MRDEYYPSKRSPEVIPKAVLVPLGTTSSRARELSLAAAL